MTGLPTIPVIVLALANVLSAQEAWKPAVSPLLTRWARQINPAAPLPEYPRPQMVRAQWQNLNGLWKYTHTGKEVTIPPKSISANILVPFPHQSALSGVGKPCQAMYRMWYRRTFTVPADWKDQRIILHFGAVNWHSTVHVNGAPVGEHKGGFTGFQFDVTSQLKSGENELIVSASNPLATDVPNAQVVGKQRVSPGGIFYTAATGIWQTVWLEPVPKQPITDLKITPDVDAKSVNIAVHTQGKSRVTIDVLDGKTKIASIEGEGNKTLTIPIPEPKLWSPDTPHLYDLQVTAKSEAGSVDTVMSYFAMRKISLGKDAKGQNRILLNNKFVFQRGVLDQGYWPDGIFTAPTDEALKYDLEVTKQLGFNMSRKHAKVEPSRWYYWADKLGVLVWQDMPQMFGEGKEGLLSNAAKQQFEAEWREEMEQFHNHPSIVVWTTFNEGWGQHDTERVVSMTEQIDPSRLVNNASGWTDKNVGHIHDTHAYPTPHCELPSATRASVCGEFGGLGMRVDGHMWSKGAWGYQGVYSTAYPLTRKYQQLQQIAWKLAEERGMSGFVYTQLTDVEEESNGLLTYDRAVIKPDLKIVTAANQGKFLPLPPNPNPAILETSAEEVQTWSFTLEKPAENWFKSDFDATVWKSGPGVFGKDVPSIGTAWTSADIYLRREFTLPNPVPAKLILNVLHDEDAEIYLNGVLAAKVEKFVGTYVPVTISDEAMKALKPGKNIIAVHCHQTTGGQGIDVGISVVK